MGSWTGHVPRPRLVARLEAAAERPLVLVDGPPGYGKTSLLSEWLRTGAPGRRSAWLTLGPMDTSPRRLLALLIGAVRDCFPGFDCRIGPVLPEAGAAPAVEAAVPGFLEALRRLPDPLVIVLDGAQVLQGPRVQELVDVLAAGLPPGVQLAVATRADPPLPLARRRAGGAVLELRADDLRFGDDEVAALVAASGLGLEGPDAQRVRDELLARTEGWPVGVALALRAMRSEPDPVRFASGFAGTHRDVSDYLVEEVLRRLSPEVRTFLARTSILPRLSGGLCDAVLDGAGSQAVLERLERSNLFVVALDADRRWYRYHRVFAEVLRAELQRTRPAVVAELHRRASAWLDAAGAQREAAEHALAALRLTPPAGRRAGLPIAGSLASDGGIGPPPPGPMGPPGPMAPGPMGPPGQWLGPREPVGLGFGQRLTDRELTILRLFPSRLSQREIAEELFLSVNTVKTHSRAIYRKLGVSSRQAATDRARELALLDGRGRGRRPDGVLAS